MKNFGEFEKTITVNENEVLNETLGGRLMGAIEDMRELARATNAPDKDVKSMLDAVDAMEKVFKKSLKGKGISGW